MLNCQLGPFSTLTGVLVFRLVHLTVGAFPRDSNNFKLVHAALAPVYLRFFNFSISGATESGNIRVGDQ